MAKLREFALNTNFVMVVFCLVGLRLFISSASIGDAIVISAICGLKGFNSWLESIKETPLSEKVEKDLADIRAHVSGMVIKNSVKPASPVAETNRRFF